ncbi:hypothetical protein RND81_12G083800 [Saponaria officinalis]|uniref:FAR1 domain-containing protein n=1 Tax=Saponaria officinalis TaxID=3572 RepID=A0AAW1H829_SAPOF
MSSSDAATANSTTQIFPILDENVSTPLATVVPLGIKEYIPFCQDDKKPKLGQIFESLQEGVSFYREYAKICGFTSRLATTRSKDGTFVLRNVLCNRQGSTNDKKRKRETISANNVELPESSQTRSRVITRIGCESYVQFKKSENGTYIVNRFHEGHNHPLVSPESMMFLKENRNMTSVQKIFIVKTARLKLGGVKAFRG